MVKIEMEHPPLINMPGMETLTVIPLEWEDNGRYNSREYNYLESHITKALISGVRRSRVYRFIDPVILRNVDITDYWEYVDVYLDCEIISVTTKRETKEIEEKNGNETKTKKYTIVTVTVTIKYQYISAIDGKMLGAFYRTVQASEKFERSKSSVILGIAAFLLSGETSSDRLAIKAVRDISLKMNNEINPHTVKERIRMLQSTSKDPAFKEAEKLVRKKRYDDAFILYERIYEETGSIAAGYNMAILLKANNRFMEALILLESLTERIAKNGGDTLPVIKEEIEKLNLVVNGNRNMKEL
ncbi:MAG: hypothetical protein FWD91_06220 [Treponema sp.]|nr:hypothetical protein [Treponema sp.]